MKPFNVLWYALKQAIEAVFHPSSLFTSQTGAFYEPAGLGDTALVLGSERNTQVEFDAVGAWVVGSNMSISGGKLNAINGWSTGQSTYLIALTQYVTYLVEFTVIDWVGVGSFQVRMGNSPLADGLVTVTGNGTYRAVLRSSGTSAPNRLAIECTSPAGFSMSMTRLSVIDIVSGYAPSLFQDSAGALAITTAEQPAGLVMDEGKSLTRTPITYFTGGDFSSSAGWVTGAGVAITGGVATFTSVAANLDSLYKAYRPTSTTDVGALYQVTFTISGYVSGSVNVQLNGGVTTARSANGTYTEKFILGTGNTNLVFKAGAAGTTLNIDDVILERVEGVHASQTTAAARPTWGARKNLVLASEDFSVASWVKSAATATANSLVETATSLHHHMYQDLTSTVVQAAGARVTYSIEAKQGVGSRHLQLLGKTAADGSGYANFDLANGVLGTVSAGNNSLTASIVATTDGYYRCAISFFKLASAGSTVYPTIADSPTMSFANGYAGDGTSSILLRKAQAEHSPFPTEYQRVNTASDYAHSSFSKHLYSDGVDDATITTTGGGSTTAFYYAEAFQCLKVGARQTFFSDAGTNTGYKVELNASNQLAISAGNGTAYTTVATQNTVSPGGKHIIQCYHDGTTLFARLDGGEQVSIACGTRTAGTAGFTCSKDNGAASGFMKSNTYGCVYGKDTCWTALERENTRLYLKALAGIAETPLVESGFYWYGSDSSSGLPAGVQLILNADGSATMSSGETVQWADTITTGIGSSYWVELVETAASMTGGSFSGTVGSRVALSAGTEWTLSRAGIGANARTLRVSIYDAASGGSLITTGTLQMEVDRAD